MYTLDFWTCLCPLLVALTDLVNLLTRKLLMEEHRRRELTQWIVQWGQECLTLFVQLDCRIPVTNELLLPEWLLPVPCPITLANLIVVVRCHILLYTSIPIGKVMTCIIRNIQIQYEIIYRISADNGGSDNICGGAISKAVRLCIYHFSITYKLYVYNIHLIR